LNRAELLRLARAGAEARIAQLEGEIAAIVARFPGLRRGGKQPGPARAASSTDRRRTMSPAAKRRIAAAQRKRWAKWRAKKRKEN
jgi:hypothetical protein